MEKETLLTPEGLKKIQDELDALRIKRREVALRIQEAKELGDLSENAEYHEAKNDQAFTEGRILELEALLHRAVVVEKPSKKNDTVQIGSTIKVSNNSVEREYSLVGSNEADPTSGKISNESPLGQAFLGKRKGDSIKLNTPKGVQEYSILSIS